MPVSISAIFWSGSSFGMDASRYDRVPNLKSFRLLSEPIRAARLLSNFVSAAARTGLKRLRCATSLGSGCNSFSAKHWSYCSISSASMPTVHLGQWFKGNTLAQKLARPPRADDGGCFRFRSSKRATVRQWTRQGVKCMTRLTHADASQESAGNEKLFFCSLAFCLLSSCLLFSSAPLTWCHKSMELSRRDEARQHAPNARVSTCLLVRQR